MTTAVDLFAGCGGLSKGFENEGFDVVAAFENWDVAADCYCKNFNHPVFRLDLSETGKALTAIKGLSPDIIIGGPPCQDFSHAGKRIEANRADLTESFAYIIAQVKPAFFLMENVDRARRSDTYAKARKMFKDAGYGLTERVLTASYCGVPQRRKRFFCIGVLGGTDGAVDEFLTRNLSEKEMTVRDYLGDSLDVEYYYRHPRNYSRRGIFSIDEPAPTMRGVNRPVPKGYPGHPKDAHTLCSDLRPLTTLERSLIQTFPADFRWTGSKTDREQMIGNAVPVKLGAFVAASLREFMSQQAAEKFQNASCEFETWLRDKKGLGRRSASDVLSRLRRADSMAPVLSTPSLHRYLSSLEESSAFKTAQHDVKSQLKRAVRLFDEYLNLPAI